MDKEIFHEKFVEDFVLSVRDNFQNLGKSVNFKCLLLLDNSAANPHEINSVSDCGNIFSCFSPPNVTSLIQPMDQGVIQNLKCRYTLAFVA